MTDRIDRKGACRVTGVITVKYVEVQVQSAKCKKKDS